jgi:hypothetical protein
MTYKFVARRIIVVSHVFDRQRTTYKTWQRWEGCLFVLCSHTQQLYLPCCLTRKTFAPRGFPSTLQEHHIFVSVNTNTNINMPFLDVAILPLRAIQALFSIIVLGLTAYSASPRLPHPHPHPLTPPSNRCLPRSRRLRLLDARLGRLHALLLHLDTSGCRLPHARAQPLPGRRAQVRHHRRRSPHHDLLVRSVGRRRQLVAQRVARRRPPPCVVVRRGGDYLQRVHLVR